MRACLLSIALLTAAGCATAEEPQTPGWMTGYWLACNEDGQVAENWFDAGTDLMLGGNISGADGSGFEFLRVQPNGRGGISYFAMPGGGEATEFVMTANDGHMAVFENGGHDFPQTITYQRDGDTLTATIAGDMDGEAVSMGWVFTAAPVNTGCAGE